MIVLNWFHRNNNNKNFRCHRSSGNICDPAYIHGLIQLITDNNNLVQFLTHSGGKDAVAERARAMSQP